MTIAVLLRVALAGLFAAALATKLVGQHRLSSTIAAGLGVGKNPASILAHAAVAAEAAVIVGLLLPPVADGAAVLALAWVTGAAVFWAVALPAGVDGCGCLGGFDPLRSVGPARRFAYLVPYGVLASILVADALRGGSIVALPILLLFGFAFLLVATGPVARDWIQRSQERALKAPTDLRRRRLLARAAFIAVASFLAPLARPGLLLADTCGSFSCVRFYTICSCCTCSGGRSCDGCYKYVCRTCTGPYGNYQQCAYVIPTWCYANICSPCGRQYISTCGCCAPCPI